MTPPRPLVLCALLLLLAACNGSPTEPHGGMATLVQSCSPSGANVTCTVTAANVGQVVYGDVTGEATWLSSGTPGSFVQPGVFVPAGSGEVEIWARYTWKETETKSMFLVSPTAPARRLMFVGGNVVDAASKEKLVGATVRILDGYAAGKSATTNSIGYYSIKPILTGETFTLEASFPGYAPKTLTYRIESPGGNPFLDVGLDRLTP
jgi:hypothetical protein